MKKIIENIQEVMRENKMTFLCILLFFLVGIVLGSYTVYYMSDFNKVEIGNYFNNFMEFIKTNNISYSKIFLDSILNIIPMIIIIILLGYTILGAPFILIIDLAKGYVLGFTFSLLVSIMGGKGAALLGLGLMLQNLIFIPCLILISIVAVKNSILKLKDGISKERNRFDCINKNYINIQSILSIILIVGILIETYISPNLIRLVITR